MDEANQQRMADLLRKSRRKKLVPDIVQKWAARGVSVSSLSDDRQQDLLIKLRTWSHSGYRPITDLRGVILEFLDDLAVAVVVDFDVKEKPALLIPAQSLSASEKDLRAAYQDGFVIFREEAALIVDFEEGVGRVNVSYAAAR